MFGLILGSLYALQNVQLWEDQMEQSEEEVELTIEIDDVGDVQSISIDAQIGRD
jgi:hypothetical protein